VRPEDHCLEPGELDRLATLPDPDRRLAHVRGCPRCRALVEAHRLYHAPTPEELEAPHVQAADAALSAHVSRLTSPARGLAAPAPAAWWKVLLTPALRPAMAFAAITIVVGAAVLVPRLLPRHSTGVLRGESRATMVLEPLRHRADGALVLRWQPVPEATHYRIEFYSTSLEEAGRTPELTGTSVELLPAQLPAAARTEDLLVRVVALRDGEALAHSDAEPLLR